MDITVHIIPNEDANPPGKLADAELRFTGGLLDGLRLVGFAVWQSPTRGRNVTFPARTYRVLGEPRAYALLRPLTEAANTDRVRDHILQAYAAYEHYTQQSEEAASV